jgi:hypothetical protein
MKDGLILDVVIGQCHELVINEVLGFFDFLTTMSKDQKLLVRGNAFLILDLGLDVIDRVGRLNLMGNSFSSHGLDKYLHFNVGLQNQMKFRLILDVVFGQRLAVLKLLTMIIKAQTLPVWGNTFLILDLGLDVLDRVRRFNLKCHHLSSHVLDKEA